MNPLETLLGEISQRWGWEVGEKIKTEIEAIIGAGEVNLQQLQSAIETIQGLLDADEGTPEFDVGQNIITQLTDHLARIGNLETQLSAVQAQMQGLDETYVSKAALAAISAETLAGIFRAALDCGFGGASLEDTLNASGDCASGGGDGDAGSI